MNKRKADVVVIDDDEPSGKRSCITQTTHSTIIRRFQDGRLSSVTEMKDDINHGTQELHDEVMIRGVKTATLVVTNFINGVKCGPQYRYVGEVLREVFNWDNDQKHGKVIRYYADGRIKEASLWNTGVLIRSVSWNESAELVQEEWFNNGMLTFSVQHIDDNSVQHTWYNSREQLQLVLIFDANNRIKSMLNYDNGSVCGQFEYNQDNVSVLHTSSNATTNETNE